MESSSIIVWDPKNLCFEGKIEKGPRSSLSAGNIGYGTLEMNKAKGSLKRLLDILVKN